MNQEQALILLKIVWRMLHDKKAITSTQLEEWAKEIAWGRDR